MPPLRVSTIEAILKNAALYLIAGLLALVTPSLAAAHHDGTAPTKIKVIERIYPDLHTREVNRTPTNWNRLRAMASVRWDRTHPAARARHRALEREREEREFAQRRADMWNTVASCESGGNWGISTGNGYYGGLQMDVTFQRSHGGEFYARWGTANNWPAWAQMAAANDAYETRGLAPWPVCGHQRLGYRPVP